MNLFQTITAEDDYFKNIIKLNRSYRIDVPPGYDRIETYRASLGHKSNHRFKNNAHYEKVKSPRLAWD